MSVRAVLVLITLVLASACGGSSVHATAANVVRSRVYGYHLAKPAGWSSVLADHRLAPGESPFIGAPVTDVIARRATRRFRLLSQPALVIGAQPVRSGTTLGAWTTSITAMVDRFKGCPSPAARTRTTVAGTAATELLYLDCPPASGLFHVWTVFIHRGLGYQFVWFDTGSRRHVDTPIMQRILLSLTLTP